MTCPGCHLSDEVEITHDDRYYCVRCRAIFEPDTTPSLYDPPPRERRDTHG